MIGMTLSLISILAMLALYKNMVGISVRSIQDSQLDGQVSAGLLTAQLEMRNAGFGIDPPISDSIILLSGAALENGALTASSQYAQPSQNTGNALIWISKASSTADATCAGLLAYKGRLIHLKGATGCTKITQWSTTTWTPTILIDTPKKKLADDANYVNLQLDRFFTTESLACWPYGKTTPLTNRLKITMTASVSAKDSTGKALESTSEVCLSNLPIPASP